MNKNKKPIDRDEFLSTISKIESSGGKNFDHREIQSGIHEGTSAIGRYGLMPNTIQELIRRKERIIGPKQNEYYSLKNADPDKVKHDLEENPEAEQMFARQLADKIGLQDDDRAAYKWHKGHNIPIDSITDEQLDNDEYTTKYRKLKQILNK